MPAPADSHKYSDVDGYSGLGDNDAEKDAEAKKRVTASLAFAKGELTGVLHANEELTAFDELEALVTTLTTIGGAPSGVLKDRLEAIDTALLKNNVDDLDDTDGDNGTTNNNVVDPVELDALKADATDHIVKALMALKNLDNKAAQKTAIQELVALLTKVDDLHMSAAALNSETPATDAMPIDIDDDNLAAAEVTAFKNVVMKFNALEMALAGRNIDTAADTDTDGDDAGETAV